MGAESSKRKLSSRELLIALALAIVLVLLALPLVRNTLYTDLSRTCPGNLKEWGVIFAMYRDEHDNNNPPPHGFESFGPASNAPGCSNIDDAFDFAPDFRVIFPDYANDPVILACPSSRGHRAAKTIGPAVTRRPGLDPRYFAVAEGDCPEAGAITRPGASYTYLGYEVLHGGDDDLQVTPEQALRHGLPAAGPANVVAILERFTVHEGETWRTVQERRGNGFLQSHYLSGLGPEYLRPPHDEVFPLNWSAGNPAALALGIDNSARAQLYPELAVMWDTIYINAAAAPQFTHNEPAGCNVLYHDGHVEFVTYPGRFPLSKSFATMTPVR